MIDESENYLSQSLKQFQRFVRKSGPSASAAYTLLAAVLFLGGLGFYGDYYFNSSPLSIDPFCITLKYEPRSPLVENFLGNSRLFIFIPILKHGILG